MRPTMYVVAGPSGAGKSRLFPVSHFGVDAFNVDDFAAALHGSYVGVTPALRALAGRVCEDFVRDHIAAGAGFAVETTLRTAAAIEQAAQARAAGFSTVLVYLATSDEAVNIERVRVRGLMGGHSAPLPLLSEIFAASFANLCRALTVFERARLYDNSGRAVLPTAHVARVDDGIPVLAPDAPLWARRAVESLNPP